MIERRRLGRTGLDVSVLGFGGSEFGFERATVATVRRPLHDALDAGLNVVDTAECYGDSETLIGEGLAGRRGEVHLFTKCGHFEGTGRDDWRPVSLERSIARSLARLRTDHVDLLQLHTCTEEDLRRGEVIEVVERARARGQARFLGYSGDGAAARYAVECGRFDALPTSVCVADQEVLELTLPPAIARDVGVIAKRPLANAAWREGQRPDNAYHHVYWDRLQQLDYDFLAGRPPDRRRPRFAAASPPSRLTVATTSPADGGTGTPGRRRDAPRGVRAPPARWRAVADASWTGQR